jgi:hypothetical protein
LRVDFELLSLQEVLPFQQGAEELHIQSTFLESEIEKILKQTNGWITWRKLALLLAGGAASVQPACHVSVMISVMALKDSHYTTIHIFPLLYAD